MSNSLAIAAVTAALRSLLHRGFNESKVDPNSDPPLAHTEVTTRPPDRARNNISGNQLNLFLYQTVPNAAWRNMDMPRQVRAGETGFPPLPLNLYYLMTAYSDDDDTDGTTSHWLLGRAMSVLHDHPVLSREEVERALAGSGLPEQFERLRITPQSLSLQELFNLWSTFQTQYRVSAAYEVTVVLIESTRAARTPLPVLTRGPGDQGVIAQADLTPSCPTLVSVYPPNNEPSARLGDSLLLSGHHLEGDSVAVRFSNPRLTDPVPTRLLENTATEIKVKILDAPDDPVAPARWVAGVYTVAAVISRAGEPDRTTNELPLMLAPRITMELPITVARNPSGDAVITLTCSPQVQPAQRAALLLGDREVLAQPYLFSVETRFAEELDRGEVSNELREQFQRCGQVLASSVQVTLEEGGSDWIIVSDDKEYSIRRENQALNVYTRPHPAQRGTLTFLVTAALVGDHFVRLRVDGVDSLLVNRTVTPPVFDQNQKVRIT